MKSAVSIMLPLLNLLWLSTLNRQLIYQMSIHISFSHFTLTSISIHPKPEKRIKFSEEKQNIKHNE